MLKGQDIISLLKKDHLPPAYPKQAFRIVAIDLCGIQFRSKWSRSNVLSMYTSAHGFFARLASGTFLTRLEKRVLQHPLIP